MKSILVLVCVSSVNPLTRRYQITFPGRDTYSYAKLYGTIDRPLNDFTLCHWSRTNVNNGQFAAVFSYAEHIGNNHNSILSMLRHNQEIHFYRNLHLSKIETNIRNTDWIQTCYTWSVIGNSYQVFVNGKKVDNGTKTSEYTHVQPNGVVILGQNQDAPGTGFDILQGLTGQISELHLWDYILTQHRIDQVYSCSNPQEGNIIAWNQAAWALYNGTRISPVDLPCGRPQ